MKESRSAQKPTNAASSPEPAVPGSAELELPADGGIRLELPGFEGPLDLLLHLIQEHELDVLNIPISFITKKYLEYIGLMEELNIDIASEYLVMAATLAHIKSRMLLPTPPADLEEGEEEELDPRAELIRRLLEYQKYKKAGEELASRSVLGRDTFVRGALPVTDPTTAPLAPASSFKLLEAFQRILARAKIVVDHQIEFERFSLSDRINQLVDLLKNKGRVLFDALFEGQRNRADLIVTFLALLELTRLRMTRLYQEGSLEAIFVELAVNDDDEAAAALNPEAPLAEALSTETPSTETPSTETPNDDAISETSAAESSDLPEDEVVAQDLSEILGESFASDDFSRGVVADANPAEHETDESSSDGERHIEPTTVPDEEAFDPSSAHTESVGHSTCELAPNSPIPEENTDDEGESTLRQCAERDAEERASTYDVPTDHGESGIGNGGAADGRVDGESSAQEGDDIPDDLYTPTERPEPPGETTEINAPSHLPPDWPAPAVGAIQPFEAADEVLSEADAEPELK